MNRIGDRKFLHGWQMVKGGHPARAAGNDGGW